jgi:DNA processing protein
MAVRGAGPYAGGMVSDSLEEHAALVALLRVRPGGLSWPSITAELLEVGSAARVWERHAPAALMELPGEVTPASVVADLQGWAAQGYRLISILDEDYPEGLRGIHEAPPVIFTRGTVLVDDPGGDRRARAGAVAVLAGRVREQAVVPHAERDNVGLRAGDGRGRGGRAERRAHSGPGGG